MRKIIATAGGVAALGLTAGVFYWTHEAAHSRSPNTSQTAPVLAANAISEKAPPYSAASSKSDTKGRPIDSEAATAATPLRAGEVLEFAADVAKLSNVANLRLTTVERRSFFGKPAWHLQAIAHTENPLRIMFELDDQFDSYSDTVTLASLQYEMHLSERGEKQESIQRMTTVGTDTAPGNATETRVVPGTRDPLGLMQYLRTVDWEKVREVHGPVYDGRKLYEVRASYAGRAENIAVPAGTFAASKIDLRVFDAGAELKDAHFTLYLARNPSRTPVLLEAVMPFATARVALTKMK